MTEEQTQKVNERGELLTMQHTKEELEKGLLELQAKRNVQLPSIGRIVHYVLESGRYRGEHRPAIIVRIWGTPTPDYFPAVQLQVFTDGSNDGFLDVSAALGTLTSSANVIWRTSVHYDENKEPGTWHWPEKV